MSQKNYLDLYRRRSSRFLQTIASTTRRRAMLLLSIAGALTALVLGIGLSIDRASGQVQTEVPISVPDSILDASRSTANTQSEQRAARNPSISETPLIPSRLDAPPSRHDAGHVPLPSEPAIPGLVAERVSEPGGDHWPTFWRSGTVSEIVATLMESMSDEKRVAQVFLLGWQGVEPSPAIMDWITQRGLGGVKVFGWNASDLTALSKSIRRMQAAALDGEHAIPLFTATDQEGGWIRHIRGNTARTPGNMAIGATGLADDAYRSGYYIGRELRALGINMNFAPTVDIYSNLDAHVIGSRAFSDDPIQTAVLGNAFFRGIEHNRVIATAKHFPGHGRTAEDSHGVLPVLHYALEDLRKSDLIPYEYLIRESIPAIMSGHLSFPEITEPNLPASLSRFFNTTLLRADLGFEGLIITDDLWMEGARSYERRNRLRFGELSLKALEAGADMVMLSQTPSLNDEIWWTVFGEYQENPEFREEVDRSVERVLTTKLRYLRDEHRVTLQPNAAQLTRRVPDPIGQEFFLDHAARSVTVLRDDALPLNPQAASRVLLIGGNSWFLSEGRAHLPGADTLRLRSAFYNVAGQDRTAIRERASRYDVVVFCLTSPATQQLLDLLEDHDGTVIVLSTLTPAYLLAGDWVDAAIAVYGIGRQSFEAGFATLTGRIFPEGRLPFTLRSGW